MTGSTPLCVCSFFLPLSSAPLVSSPVRSVSLSLTLSLLLTQPCRQCGFTRQFAQGQRFCQPCANLRAEEQRRTPRTSTLSSRKVNDQQPFLHFSASDSLAHLTNNDADADDDEMVEAAALLASACGPPFMNPGACTLLLLLLASLFACWLSLVAHFLFALQCVLCLLPFLFLLFWHKCSHCSCHGH
jgi:hypothetical protein